MFAKLFYSCNIRNVGLAVAFPKTKMITCDNMNQTIVKVTSSSDEDI